MMEFTLEEEIPEEFMGGKLQLNEEKQLKNEKLKEKESPPETTNINNVNNTSCTWKNNLISPLTQITSSIWNKKESNVSTTATNNVLQPAALILTRENANNFFTFRDDIVEKAVKECMEELIDIEKDGPLINSFLLTEINLWDTEKERLVLLTHDTFLIIKYDFIALKRLDYKKIPLEHIDSIIIGDLIYPNGSLIPNRNMRGIRIMWNKGQPLNFATKWNPFTSDIPLCTFTSHPLFFHKDCTNENQRKHYDIEELIENLCQAVSKFENDKMECVCLIHHKNIILENYIGIASLVHNRNALGFFKVRGKVSF